MSKVELLESETLDMQPRILPPGWKRRLDSWNGIYSFQRGLSVIWSVERVDGKRWKHLSVSGMDRLPTWDELHEMKNWLFGFEARAIQVLPPESEYINRNSHVLHLWECLDEDILPDFRREGGL